MLLTGPPAAAIAAPAAVGVGAPPASDDMLNSVPTGLTGGNIGLLVVKSICRGPFSRLEAPRVSKAAPPAAAPAADAAMISPRELTFSTTGGPFALAESMVSAWFPNGLLLLASGPTGLSQE